MSVGWPLVTFMLDFLRKRPDGIVRYVQRDLHLYDGLSLLLELCLEIPNLLHELFDGSTFFFVGRRIAAAAFGVVGETITTGTGSMMLGRLRLLPDRS